LSLRILHLYGCGRSVTFNFFHTVCALLYPEAQGNPK